MMKAAQRVDDSVAEDGVGSDSDVVEDSSEADVMSVQGSADGDSEENTTADELDRGLEMAYQQIPGLDVDAIRDWLLLGSDKVSDTLLLSVPDVQRDKATLFEILPALRHLPGLEIISEKEGLRRCQCQLGDLASAGGRDMDMWSERFVWIFEGFLWIFL